MKPMFSTSCMIASLLAFLVVVGQARAETDVTTLATTVKALGRINGQALACGYSEIASRLKAIMITRVPKTREQGERYEQATNEAFLAQGRSTAGCPQRAALAVELDTVARPLVPPASHQNITSPEAPEVGINPRYLLQATNGRSIMDGDFRDRFQLIAFGYTFCPDICPTTLLEMAAILKELGEQARHVQPIFISVDPERDTLPHLRQYLDFFDKRIIGATGSAELVRHAAASFKVRYEKVIDPNGSPQNYVIDHSAGMYLLAPGGQYLTRFAYGTPVADIVQRLGEEIRRRFDRSQPAAGAPAAPPDR